MTFQEIAESILGGIRWKDESKGFCSCPGGVHHTGPNKSRDCEVFLTPGRPPTISCFHQSCRAEIDAANHALRSAIGREEFAQKQHVKMPAPRSPRPVQSFHHPKPAPGGIKITERRELPDPMPDGARQLIRAAFLPGEGIRICLGSVGDNGREEPRGGGIVLSREEWLTKLDAKNGNPNGIFKSTDRTGIFITVNPMKSGPGRDEDVTVFRHALVEFDDISPEEQFNLYRASRIPITAVISSGGKSIHAWVRVDAANRREFDERVAAIYDHFAAYKPDHKNVNPSRFSRLPNCERFDRRQELLEIHDVPENAFVDWQAATKADGIGIRYTRRDLKDIDLSDMSDVLLGDDWINKGGSCVISAQSGVGKSVLAFHMGLAWAVGMGWHGVTPSRPLKNVIISAENHKRDNKRMLEGVESHLGIDFDPRLEELADRNFVVRENSALSGDDFVAWARDVAAMEKPDIMWLDPAAAFVGDDIAKQVVVSKFFRNGLQPMASHYGFAWFVLNHFTKPSTDSKSRSAWTQSDHQYRGAGSYDLPGWARAGIVIENVERDTFRLRMAKRGKLSGLVDLSGAPSNTIFIQHASDGIYWRQVEVEEGDEPDGRQKPAKPPSIPEQVAALNLGTFLSACPPDGEGLNEIAARLGKWLKKEHRMEPKAGTLKACIHKLGVGESEYNTRLIEGNGKLEKGDDGQWRKGPNA